MRRVVAKRTQRTHRLLRDSLVAGALLSSLTSAVAAQPPVNPDQLSSTTHQLSTWSSARRIEISWSGAEDLSGSGLDGYSVRFDTDPTGEPDTEVDHQHLVDPNIFTGEPLESGQEHWFHLRTCDETGACSETIHLGPFWIDADEPVEPILESTSHVVGVWSSNPTVDVLWSGATDPDSGLAGYSVAEGPEIPTQPHLFDRMITNRRPNDLLNPSGVAAGPTGDLFVVDAGDLNIKRYTADGDFIASFGEGELTDPEELVVGPDGSVYVVDDVEVKKYDAMGQLEATWGGEGSGDGEFSYAMDIAIAPDGNLFVIDLWGYRVQKFDAAGNYLLQWGSSGSGDGEFSFPNRLTVDPNGDVYVLDNWNHRVQKFDGEGNYLLQWGSEGFGDGEFTHPYGIDADGAGNVFVMENYDHRLQRFDTAGNFLETLDLDVVGELTDDSRSLDVVDDQHIYTVNSEFGAVRRFDYSGNPTRRWSGYGSRPGNLISVQDIAIDEDGTFYAAVYHEGWLKRFDRTGGHLANVDWTFLGLQGVAIAPNGHLITTNTFDNWGRELEPDGSTVRVYADFVRPFGVETDSVGNIYFSDELGYEIWKYDSEGNLIDTWGAFGTGPGEFNRPRGVGIDSQDQVYVADYNNQRVQKFDADGVFIRDWGVGALTTAIAVDDNDLVYVSGNDEVLVYDAVANLITSFGERGQGEGQFDLIEGLDVDRWGVVYVADLFNDRVQVFRPQSVPPFTVEIAHGSDPHLYTTPLLDEGANQFVRVRACDETDRCTDPVSFGPVSIDFTAPGPPASISSTSHEIGEPNTLEVIEMEWTAAVDLLSGLGGYAYAFDADADWSCDQVVDLDAEATTVSSAALAPGEWFFHLCGVDGAGNWAVEETAGPYVVSGAEADLSIDALVNVDPVLSSQPLLVRFEAANLGPAEALDVSLSITTPLGVRLLATSPADPICVDTEGAISCSLGDLAAGTTSTVFVELAVQDAVLGFLNLDAQITSTVPDFNTVNNSNAVTTQAVRFGRARSVIDPDGFPGRLVATLLRDPTEGTTAATSDPLTGATLMSWSMPDAGEPLDLETIDLPLGSDAHELAVLMQLDGDEPWVVLLDSETGALLGSVLFTAGEPIDLEIVPDMDGDGAPELALLSIDPASGTGALEIRAPQDGAVISEIGYETRLPIALSTLTDFAAGPNPELAVLGVDPTLGLVEIEIRDAGTGVMTSEFTLDPSLLPSRQGVAPSFVDSPADELVVLGRTHGSAPEIHVYDAADESLVSVVLYSADLTPASLVVDTASDSDPPRALVAGIHGPSRNAIVEMRDLTDGTTVFDFAYPSLFGPIEGLLMPLVPPDGVPNIGYLGTRSSDGVGVVPLLSGENGSLLRLILLP